MLRSCKIASLITIFDVCTITWWTDELIIRVDSFLQLMHLLTQICVKLSCSSQKHGFLKQSEQCVLWLAESCSVIRLYDHYDKFTMMSQGRSLARFFKCLKVHRHPYKWMWIQIQFCVPAVRGCSLVDSDSRQFIKWALSHSVHLQTLRDVLNWKCDLILLSSVLISLHRQSKSAEHLPLACCVQYQATSSG